MFNKVISEQQFATPSIDARDSVLRSVFGENCVRMTMTSIGPEERKAAYEARVRQQELEKQLQTSVDLPVTPVV